VFVPGVINDGAKIAKPKPEQSCGKQTVQADSDPKQERCFACKDAFCWGVKIEHGHSPMPKCCDYIVCGDPRAWKQYAEAEEIKQADSKFLHK